MAVTGCLLADVLGIYLVDVLKSLGIVKSEEYVAFAWKLYLFVFGPLLIRL